MRCLRGSLLLLGVFALITFAGCGAPQQEEPAVHEEPAAAEPAAEELAAVAELQGREGSGVTGTVTLTQSGGEVTIVADVQGAAPAGPHGFHLHEVGDCSAPDFTSAGGHFNPGGVEHACPPDAPRHAGDLGNLEIGEDGSGYFELTTDLVTLGEGETSVVGRAVILHEAADDCESQPTGAAGSRLACGIIALAGGEDGEEGAEDGEGEGDE